MSHRSNDRNRAEAAFKAVQKVQDGEKATTESAAEAQAVQEKTSRLRSLRLAKEARNLEPAIKKARSLD